MKFLIKNILILIWILPCSELYAQNKNDRSGIRLEILSKAELITDVLIDIPKDCKVTGYTFTMTGTDKKLKLKCVGNELRLEINAAFRNAKPGDRIIFEKVNTACLDKHKSKYIFNVVQ